MAYAATQNQVVKKSVFEAVTNAFSAFFKDLAVANARANEAQQLHSMTDRQLADIGVKRSEIAQRVFADHTTA